MKRRSSLTKTVTTKTTALSSTIKKLKRLHNLNATIEYYDHSKEMENRQLIVKAFEQIEIELSEIKKQLHLTKHKGDKRG